MASRNQGSRRSSRRIRLIATAAAALSLVAGASAAALLVVEPLALEAGFKTAGAPVAAGSDQVSAGRELAFAGETDGGQNPVSSARTPASQASASLSPPTEDPASLDPASVSQAAPSTAPSSKAGGPVTTVAAGPAADPSAIYRGVVGLLGPTEVVAAAVAPAPAAAPGTQPLTGLPGEAPDRPAAVVKIDNSGPARPQAGIEQADIVFEEEVEGGVTRLAAVFHSLGGVVGPVRSGRTTDIPVIDGLGTPLLLYSGANEATDALLLRQAGVQNRAANRSSGYWREKGRKAPHNLYTDLAAHWASATGGPPPAQFAYRAVGQPAGGDPVDHVAVDFRSNKVSWVWNGELWARSQGGKPHTVAAGGQLAVGNVVVIETRKVDTGMVDVSGATVPEFVFVGAGRATVFTDGHRITGTWTRHTLSSAATLTTDDGAVIALTPGRTWVEIVEAASS